MDTRTGVKTGVDTEAQNVVSPPKHLVLGVRPNSNNAVKRLLDTDQGKSATASITSAAQTAWSRNRDTRRDRQLYQVQIHRLR
ncbi:hypothetical protein [Salinisphaera hydrothermalis]|uniref:hypothetical protein n=1 Tax=Salinisphaera hydrothermalis TaxID=563188 RepID=UPI003340490B